MICPRCTSPRKSFNGEVAIHFPGKAGLHKPIVWVFPETLICLNCGSAEFVVPEKERAVLSEWEMPEDMIVTNE
jgi:hypothetical protein